MVEPTRVSGKLLIVGAGAKAVAPLVAILAAKEVAGASGQTQTESEITSSVQTRSSAQAFPFHMPYPLDKGLFTAIIHPP